MNKIFGLLKKYREIIVYGIFGVLTTLVNLICYVALLKINVEVLTASMIAWVVSVLFAFLTNRKWVFESKERRIGGIIGELVKFSSGRVLTQIIDICFLAVFVKWLKYNEVIMKLIANVFVIILNYVFSKFIVFRKK